MPPTRALTLRQSEVIDLLSRGLSNREIAERRGVTEQAVKAIVSRLLVKFGVHNRTGLLVAAIADRIAREQRGTAGMWTDAAIIVFDGEGKVVEMTDTGARIAGGFDERRTLAEQNQHYAVRDLLTGRPLEPEETPLGRALAGESLTNERFLVRKPGAPVDVIIRTNVLPLRDAAGRPSGAVALVWEESPVASSTPRAPRAPA